jgi:hypothetical protein
VDFRQGQERDPGRILGPSFAAIRSGGAELKTVFWYKGHKVEIDRDSEHENPIEVAIDNKDLTGAFWISGFSPVMFANLMKFRDST